MNQRELIEQRRQQEKRKKRLTYILIGGGVALIIAAILIIPSLNLNQTNVAAGDINVPDLEERPMADGSGLGDPDAPVVIKNYSDFACPHCADFSSTTEKQIIEEYVKNGDVYFEYHSVGNLLGSSASVQAAEAAYCAADQGRFWGYHDLIFANQSSLFTDPNADISPTLNTFAEVLELDLEQFENCYAGDKYANRVQQDQVEAQQAGVTGTPSFVINGRLLKGNVPFSNFQQVIEQELSNAGE